MSEPIVLFGDQFVRLVNELKRGIFELDTKANALFALFEQEQLRRQQPADDQENQLVTGDDPNGGDGTASDLSQTNESDYVSVQSEIDSEGEWENNENNQRIGTDQVIPIASTSSAPRRSTRKPVKRKDLSHDDTATSDDDDSDRERGRARRKGKSARVNSSPAVRTRIIREVTNKPDDTKQVITRYLNCTVPGCVTQCKDKAKLKKHLKSKHGVYLDRCHVRGCQATFPNPQQIGDHLRSIHSTLTHWPCDICTVQCPSHRKLVNHVWKKHEQGHFACGYTGCRFTSRISRAKVIDHYRHHQPATHQCTFTGCGKAFKTSRDLKKHLVTHTGEKPFRCVTCNTAFAQKYSLTKHQKRQTHQRIAELTAAK